MVCSSTHTEEIQNTGKSRSCFLVSYACKSLVIVKVKMTIFIWIIPLVSSTLFTKPISVTGISLHCIYTITKHLPGSAI